MVMKKAAGGRGRREKEEEEEEGANVFGVSGTGLTRLR
jgi:hypothetical protein